MPKYFTDEKELPFDKVALDPEDLTADRLEELFESNSKLTLCLRFDGYDQSCLGYIFNVQLEDGSFRLTNIVGQLELSVQNMESLLEVMRHVSGISYSERVQAAFQQIRNDIGSGIPLQMFGPEE